MLEHCGHRSKHVPAAWGSGGMSALEMFSQMAVPLGTSASSLVEEHWVPRSLRGRHCVRSAAAHGSNNHSSGPLASFQAKCPHAQFPLLVGGTQCDRQALHVTCEGRRGTWGLPLHRDGLLLDLPGSGLPSSWPCDPMLRHPLPNVSSGKFVEYRSSSQ